ASRGGGIQAADQGRVRCPERSVFCHRAAVGRRHHRAERNAAGAGAGLLRGAQCAGGGDEVWGVSNVSGARIAKTSRCIRCHFIPSETGSSLTYFFRCDTCATVYCEECPNSEK